MNRTKKKKNDTRKCCAKCKKESYKSSSTEFDSLQFEHDRNQNYKLSSSRIKWNRTELRQCGFHGKHFFFFAKVRALSNLMAYSNCRTKAPINISLFSETSEKKKNQRVQRKAMLFVRAILRGGVAKWGIHSDGMFTSEMQIGWFAFVERKTIRAKGKGRYLYWKDGREETSLSGIVFPTGSSRDPLDASELHLCSLHPELSRFCGIWIPPRRFRLHAWIIYRFICVIFCSWFSILLLCLARDKVCLEISREGNKI